MNTMQGMVRRYLMNHRGVPWWLSWAVLLICVPAFALNGSGGELRLYDSFEGPLDPLRWRGIGESSGQPMDMLRAPDRGALRLGARGIKGGHSRQAVVMLEAPETITGMWLHLAMLDWWAVGCDLPQEGTLTRVGSTMALPDDYTASIAVTGHASTGALVVLGQLRRGDGRAIELDLGPVAMLQPLQIGLSWLPGQGVYFQREDCAQVVGFHGQVPCFTRWTRYWVPVTVNGPRKPLRAIEAVSESGNCQQADAFSLSAVHEVWVEQ
jgi:hypothetical protein